MRTAYRSLIAGAIGIAIALLLLIPAAVFPSLSQGGPSLNGVSYVTEPAAATSSTASPVVAGQFGATSNASSSQASPSSIFDFVVTNSPNTSPQAISSPVPLGFAGLLTAISIAVASVFTFVARRRLGINGMD